jgi:hypothetical protein
MSLIPAFEIGVWNAWVLIEPIPLTPSLVIYEGKGGIR